jgi:alcohol dehydrogenase class IV
MLNFTFHQPVKILYGVNAIQQLPEAIRVSGYTKPFVVFDAGIKAAGIIDKITAALDAGHMEYTLYGDVVAEPPVSSVESAFVLFQDSGADCIVAVGGGSSMDTAKGINILRYNDGPLLRFADPTVPMNPCPGVITIPTTSGTGSELSNALVLTDTSKPVHTKHLILCLQGMAEFAVVDPSLVAGTPTKITMATGLDALAHLSESYVTVTGNLMTQPISERFMEEVVKWLPEAVRNGRNMEAREHMAIAATVGGWMLSVAFALHSIAHSIGASFGIPHGAACAYTNPYLFEWLAPTVPDRVKRIGEILGTTFTGNESPAEIGAKTRQAHLAFNTKLGLPPIEKTYKIDTTLFDMMADTIIKDPPMLLFSPKPLSKEECLVLLHKVCQVQ